MAEPKTTSTNASVTDFINRIESETKRQDCLSLLRIFEEASGEKPIMWGESIVGYGSYHYKSEKSSQEGDWPLAGFSPRKQNITLYINCGFDRYKEQLAKLGKHKTSVSCLYIKKLADIDVVVLKEIIADSVDQMRQKSN